MVSSDIATTPTLPDEEVDDDLVTIHPEPSVTPTEKKGWSSFNANDSDLQRKSMSNSLKKSGSSRS